MGPTVPIATYRIQFNLNFRFVDARDLVPYLHGLGISDLYASPRWKAGRGSSHGYDVADPQRINSELGTEEEFDELVQRLKSYGMGILLDIVPNHMAATAENPWWLDVLENGPGSRYASYFDVNWHPAVAKARFLLENKVLIPILGDLYGKVLVNGELTLKFDDRGFHIRYYDHRFPLNLQAYGMILRHSPSQAHGNEDSGPWREFSNTLEAIAAAQMNPLDEAVAIEREQAFSAIKTRLWAVYHGCSDIQKYIDQIVTAFNGIKGEVKSFEPMDRLLSEQFYRLAYWKMAGEEINYRRFFDINELVGLRVEYPRAFEDRHRTTFELIEDMTGLRIDHIDGLYDPLQYLKRLWESMRKPATGNRRTYMIVEKVLGRHESLPEEWPVSGTTGYDFLNAVNGLFVHPDGLSELEKTYRRFTGIRASFSEICYERNKLVMSELFAGELQGLGHKLIEVASQDWYARDLPSGELLEALVDVTACLPVYRTYIRTHEVSAPDRHWLEQAFAAARKLGSRAIVSDAAFEFLRNVLFIDPPVYAESFRHQWLAFVMEWQQFSGPVMAKGLEDTASYVYNALISLNEVGADSIREEPPPDLESFHAFNAERLQHWPDTLNASSTHDTKRSEDVRARLNALSEIPNLWRVRLTRWARSNRPKKEIVRGRAVPSPNEEILLYQTMLGAWPLDDSKVPEFIERLQAFMLKALREAKVHTSWLGVDSDYESGVASFIRHITEQSARNEFLEDFRGLQSRIAYYGCFSSLAQTLLKIASPGVPDFYQGCELWDFSMVDPDNRRSVNFGQRIQMLDDLKSEESRDPRRLVETLCENWRDGRIKLFLIRKALQVRAELHDVFAEGDYTPLYAAGKRRPNVCAFERKKGDRRVMVAVPRFLVSVTRPDQLPIGRRVWGAGKLILGRNAPKEWRNCLTGETVSGTGISDELAVPLAGIFRSFPVALLSPANQH